VAVGVVTVPLSLQPERTEKNTNRKNINR